MGIAQRHGRAGEALAAAYFELLRLGGGGPESQARRGRVDLVVADGATRVLVEVKLRGRSDFGGAALAVDRPKCER